MGARLRVGGDTNKEARPSKEITGVPARSAISFWLDRTKFKIRGGAPRAGEDGGSCRASARASLLSQQDVAPLFCRPAPVPMSTANTKTFVGASRLSGITAPMVLDGAMHPAAFLAYVENVLVPTLQPGGILMMGNSPAQRTAPVREAIYRAGSKLRFLRPCSHDANPIELLSSSAATSSSTPSTQSPNSGRSSVTPQTASPRPSSKSTSLLQDMTVCERSLL